MINVNDARGWTRTDLVLDLDLELFTPWSCSAPGPGPGPEIFPFQNADTLILAPAHRPSLNRGGGSGSEAASDPPPEAGG